MCAVFSLARINHSTQQLTKRLLLFPCKLYYEGQTLVTVQRVMSFLHAHFITTTVLWWWWWCWTRSKLQRSLSPSVHTPKAFPTASNFWFLFEKNNASRKWHKKHPELFFDVHIHHCWECHQSTMKQDNQFWCNTRQGDNNINVSSTYFSNKTSVVATCFLFLFF